MKIAASASGPSLEDLVDPRFGRCAFFLIIDTDTLDFEVIENSSKNLSGGAGIEAAQRVADQGVTYVLTGRCGPNAEKVLSAAKIRIVDGCEGTVRETVERFSAGSVSIAQRPAAPAILSPAPPRPTGAGRPGRFAVRGSGRGMGKGGGRGMGGGSGRGMGRGGMDRRCGVSSTAGSFPKPPPSIAPLEDDAARLRQEVEQLRQLLREKEQRIRHLEGGDNGRRSR